ncbi:MAG: DUF58 domain-containing protein, partial [Actinomycetota bacterium]
MSRHLTHRFWVCGAIGLTGILAALVLRRLEPAAISFPFLAVIVLSLADGWWPSAVAEAPTVSAPRVVEGDQLAFTIDVRTTQRVSWVELEVQFPATLVPIGSARFVTALDGVRRFTIPLTAVRWGAAGPEWAVVTTRDRYGVTERVNRYPIHLPVRIHPPSERLTSMLSLHHQRPVTGDHRSRRVGTGSELAEVRAYRPGDPVRMIHPRLTQRRGTPMVLERHPDQSGDTVLLIDSSQDLGVDLDTTLRGRTSVDRRASTTVCRWRRPIRAGIHRTPRPTSSRPTRSWARRCRSARAVAAVTVHRRVLLIDSSQDLGVDLDTT